MPHAVRCLNLSKLAHTPAPFSEAQSALALARFKISRSMIELWPHQERRIVTTLAWQGILAALGSHRILWLYRGLIMQL